MIMEVNCDVKEIKERDEGRSYGWPRPDCCPHCYGVRIWGHGFVWAFFECFLKGMYLKRYRCPRCGCVMRMKPRGYFQGFSVPVETIRASVASRVSGGAWLKDLGCNRQGHWIRALIRQVMAHLGLGWRGRLLEGFDDLFAKGIIPVSRSFKA
jgi:hypothetical protein